MQFFQNRWLIYIWERFSLSSFGALSVGLAFSGLSLEDHAVQPVSFVFCSIGILLFFGLQRLMDDVKNVDKDRLAYPERPLARKLISKEDAAYIVSLFYKALFVYSLLILVFVNAVAALIFALSIGYLWMQYRGFYLGRWLLQRPFLGGLLRHLGVFLLVFFAAAAGNPAGFLNASIWAFATMVMASFFCYDICETFNPHQHPILGTYVHFYGFRRAFEVAAIMLVVAGISAIYLQLDVLLVPCEIIVLFSMATLFWQPGLFRLPVVTSSISLMVHSWAPAIFRYFHSR